MARLAGVDIPRDKRVVIALTYIYGIGRTESARTASQRPDSRSMKQAVRSGYALISEKDFFKFSSRFSAVSAVEAS